MHFLSNLAAKEGKVSRHLGCDEHPFSFPGRREQCQALQVGCQTLAEAQETLNDNETVEYFAANPIQYASQSRCDYLRNRTLRFGFISNLISICGLALQKGSRNAWENPQPSCSSIRALANNLGVVKMSRIASLHCRVQ
jgi:hypothetical protein